MLRVRLTEKRKKRIITTRRIFKNLPSNGSRRPNRRLFEFQRAMCAPPGSTTRPAPRLFRSVWNAICRRPTVGTPHARLPGIWEIYAAHVIFFFLTSTPDPVQNVRVYAMFFLVMYVLAIKLFTASTPHHEYDLNDGDDRLFWALSYPEPPFHRTCTTRGPTFLSVFIPSLRRLRLRKRYRAVCPFGNNLTGAEVQLSVGFTRIL